MSRVEGQLFVIEPEPPGKCELCGKTDETRPYGPNGESVCFDCGMKDEAAAERAFRARLGDKVIDIRDDRILNGGGGFREVE